MIDRGNVMIPRVSMMVLAAMIAVPALAGDDDGYNPNRSCRVYVMQKLPVPVRCMAELMGNWSAKPYLDGEFMFRNRAEWLAWKDREDYRHWKNHDYAWHDGMASSPPPAAPPSAPPPAPPPVAAGPAAVLLCPAAVPAHVADVAGWTVSGNAVLRLSGARSEGDRLICTYGEDGIVLSRPAWGHCTVRADGTGFDCTP